MFLSFLIVTQNNLVKLMKTLMSIKEQTNGDYEIVLVDDTGFQPKSPILEVMSEHFYNVGKKMQVVTNLRSQGFSYGLNSSICVARGDYFMIVDEGEVIHKTAVSVLKENVTKHTKLSIKKLILLNFGYIIRIQKKIVRFVIKLMFYYLQKQIRKF